MDFEAISETECPEDSVGVDPSLLHDLSISGVFLSAAIEQCDERVGTEEVGMDSDGLEFPAKEIQIGSGEWGDRQGMAASWSWGVAK